MQPKFGAGERRHLGPGASILNFLQLSDFQMVDEESPARVESLDTTQRVPGATRSRPPTARRSR